MTIGMLLESMASKAGALDGRFIDASPFQAANDEAHIISPTARSVKCSAKSRCITIAEVKQWSMVLQESDLMLISLLVHFILSEAQAHGE